MKNAGFGWLACDLICQVTKAMKCIYRCIL